MMVAKPGCGAAAQGNCQPRSPQTRTSTLPRTSPMSLNPSSISRRGGPSTPAFQSAPGAIAASAADCMDSTRPYTSRAAGVNAPDAGNVRVMSAV